jgi:hypothetical protein
MEDPIFVENCDLAECEKFFPKTETPATVMTNRVVKAGEKYAHFKTGKVVTVLSVGQLSESPGAYMVVYQCGDDPNDIWIRPYEMFVSPVDKDKYPNAKQYFRFEKIKG